MVSLPTTRGIDPGRDEMALQHPTAALECVLGVIIRPKTLLGWVKPGKVVGDGLVGDRTAMAIIALIMTSAAWAGWALATSVPSSSSKRYSHSICPS